MPIVFWCTHTQVFPALPCASVVVQPAIPAETDGGFCPLQLSGLTAGSGDTSSGKRKPVEILNSEEMASNNSRSALITDQFMLLWN